MDYSQLFSPLSRPNLNHYWTRHKTFEMNLVIFQRMFEIYFDYPEQEQHNISDKVVNNKVSELTRIFKRIIIINSNSDEFKSLYGNIVEILFESVITNSELRQTMSQIKPFNYSVHICWQICQSSRTKVLSRLLVPAFYEL